MGVGGRLMFVGFEMGSLPPTQIIIIKKVDLPAYSPIILLYKSLKFLFISSKSSAISSNFLPV